MRVKIAANNKIRAKSGADHLLIGFCYFVAILFSLMVLLPFWSIICDAFSGAPVKLGSRMWFENFTLSAWKEVLSQNKLLNYYANTIFVTVVGTIGGVVVTFLTAYPLSKPNMPFNRLLTYMMLFTMYFGGGLIPTYLLYKDFGLHDNILVLILPGLFSAYNTLVMRNFLADVPAELEESAKLDGANDMTIAWRIYLPLAKPIIATIALWVAVAKWNAWFDAMIYIITPEKQVMQVMLRRLLMDAQIAEMFDNGVSEITVQTDAVKGVSILITILPILCTYPFAQKYFISGLTSGAVKG